MQNIANSDYNTLKEQIKSVLIEGRNKALTSVNSTLLQTY